MVSERTRIKIGLVLFLLPLLILLLIGIFTNPHELPEDNIYMQLAPLYEVCYQDGDEIICCAKPMKNVTYDKEILICDTLNIKEIEGKLLIIR